MVCSKCGKISTEGYFCTKCGSPLYAQQSVLHQNNLSINSVRYAPNYQQSHMSDNQVQYTAITSNKSKVKAKSLCLWGLFIFFPIAGLHRFYVGKIGSGLLYLLTAGLCGIGTIYDLYRLSLGMFTDNVGQPLRR